MALDKFNDFIRGDDLDFPISIVDAAGVAVNITGEYFTATLKADRASADSAAVWQVTVQAAGAQALAGKTTISVSGVVNSATPEGSYWLDIQRVTTAGKVKTHLLQQINCVADVTRNIPGVTPGAPTAGQLPSLQDLILQVVGAGFVLQPAALLATPVPGRLEYNGTGLYFTLASGVRKQITLV